jgi:hypothetical protein
MEKFVNFVLYNVIIYLLYMLIDTIFSFFHLYSSEQLGHDLTVMPTNSDFTYILINSILSMILGYYIFKKMKTIISA